MTRAEQLKQEVLIKTKELIEGKSRVNYAGRVFNEKKIKAYIAT